MIWPFTSLFGVEPWVIRIPAVLAWFAAVIMNWYMASKLFESPKAGHYAALVIGSVPIMQGGFHTVTPDAPMMLFASISYFCIWRAVTQQSARYWLIAGGMVGATLLAKYPGVLLPALLFIALLLNKDGRQSLQSLWPWLAVLLAVLLFMPVVIWNYQNDWISFAFQFNHGVKAERGASLYNLFAYVVQQMAILLPWTWIAMVIAVYQARHYVQDRFAYVLLVTGFVFPLVFFGMAGLTVIGGANWPVMAYIPGAILLGGMLASWGNTVTARRIKISLVVFTVLLSIVLTTMMRYTLELRQAGLSFIPGSQVDNTYDWPKLAAAVQTVYRFERQQGACAVMANWHYVAAELSFEFKDMDIVIPDPVSTVHQYIIWKKQGYDKLPPCVYVREIDAKHKSATTTLAIEGYGNWKIHSYAERTTPAGTHTYGIYTRLSSESVKH